MPSDQRSATEEWTDWDDFTLASKPALNAVGVLGNGERPVLNLDTPVLGQICIPCQLSLR